MRILPCIVGLMTGFAAVSTGPERTSFQTGGFYAPDVDVAADMVMVYGVRDDFRERAESWKSQGYTTGMMTGISWGNYDAYYQVDGGLRESEIQTDKAGKLFMHGNSATVGYNVPSPAYVAFIKDYITPAIDYGIHALFLEEPEYWAQTGWSGGFKEEWQRFYGEPWEPPDASVDAQWRASLLKYELYFNALRDVFHFAKTRAQNNGYTLECHVPTHSLINYAHWRIVSPMARLMDIPELDGYIAQVWTGTARTPNRYQGVVKERTLETAFLEFGQMHTMTRAMGKKVWFLADPIEDNPNYDWDDYRINYEKTIVASLLLPDVSRYEVMPWPNRIFRGTYPAERGSAERVPMPRSYAAQLLTVINALNDMDQDNVDLGEAPRGIGILVSDTMMFQRAEPHPSDAMMGSFYGLAMPLLKAGVPVEPVQLETLTCGDVLAPYSVLLLSYEHQKPLKPAYHDAIALWVKGGGALLYIGDGSDPYHDVRAWWNQEGATDARACDDLFAKLGLEDRNHSAPMAVDRGWVHVVNEHPHDFTRSAEGAERVRNLVEAMAHAAGLRFQTSNWLMTRRGPYHIAAVLDESISPYPLVKHGTFIDLFDPTLPVIDSKVLEPGEHALLYDLDWAYRRGPHVAAASGRVRHQAVNRGSLSFTVRGPADLPAVVRILLREEPLSIVSLDGLAFESEWDARSSTLLLTFRHQAADAGFTVRWTP